MKAAISKLHKSPTKEYTEIVWIFSFCAANVQYVSMFVTFSCVRGQNSFFLGGREGEPNKTRL